MSMPRSSLRSVRFSTAPLPTTGRTRRVAPSSMTLARSSAMRTEMPALRVVSSSTMPRLAPTSEPADGVFAPAEREIGKERMATTAAVMILYFIVRYIPVRSRGCRADDWRLQYRVEAVATPTARLTQPVYTWESPDTVIIFDIPTLRFGISHRPCCREIRYHAGL